MKRAIPIMAGVALTAGAQTALAQQKVPVMALAPSSAKSLDTFGAILGVRQLPSGGLLVNDAGRRRLVMLDAALSNPKVVIDSGAGTSNSYGPRPSPLIPYLGDSTLFVDAASSSLLVLDPKGHVSRVTAAPKPQDLMFLGQSAAYTDEKGRLLYRASNIAIRNGPAVPGERPKPVVPPDSASIVRADFDTRQIDTIGRVKMQNGMKMSMDQTPDGKMQMKMTMNPVQTVDDWAVLSDGSIAFVRGHDYHVDVMHPDGKTSQGAKLPFDWKRLTDDDKQKLIDSARTAQEVAQKAAAAAVSANGGAGGPMVFSGGGGAGADAMRAGSEARMVVTMSSSGGGGGGAPMVMGGGAPGGPGNLTMSVPTIDFVPLNEIADYYPAIRPGAAKADLDGNLWILPTTSAQSQGGELIYDVVNKTGELFQRVRIPQGRSIAGFGRGGIVYLMAGDRTNGFTLERSTILGGGRATQ